MPRFSRNKEGWAVFAGQPGVDTENRSWRLYISVKPTPQNLKSALTTLDTFVSTEPLFRDQKHPTIKIALPENPNQHSHYFDVTLPPPAPHIMVLDHDQMGREISISLDYDSSKNNYTYDPLIYKDLILKIWSALEAAGIELNYVTPDIDELLINCDDREVLTPFTYSAKKEEDARHGLLFCPEANPKKFSDPLNGIRITLKDLEDYKIAGGRTAVVCYKRIEFQEERNLRASDTLKKYMTEFIARRHIVPNCQTVLQNIQALIAIANNEEFLKASQELLNKINEWALMLPRRAGAKLSYILHDNEIKQCLLKTDAAKVKALREFFQDLVYRSQEEIKKIKSDMPAEPTNAKYLAEAIDANPTVAQGIFRMMIHLENAENRLEKEQNRLLHDCKFPPSYQQIWDETKGDLYEKARALLSDYTKGGSIFKLAFYGHFNRDSAQISVVEQLLNNRQLRNFNNLMSRLKDIPLKDYGSLGTRIAFIMKMNYEELLKLNAADAKPAFKV